jgi:predicted dehydrogenase
MPLTPEQKELGRRNFMRVLAGTPALAVLGGAALVKGPIKGGPVRVAGIAIGSQGKGLLSRADPAFCQIVAVADINPDSLAAADEIMGKAGKPPARHYSDWREMLQKENVEAVITSPPLWAHAEITTACLEAGKHVFCEKMMAWDDAGCDRMAEAARKSGKILEIGYQRFYNRVYQAAYDGIVKAGHLGEVYHARIVWNRNKNWRRELPKPPDGLDPKAWGYDDYDHLINWRLYKKHSRGLVAELGSHMVNVTNWFFGSEPNAVSASGGVFRFKDREVPDHFYATFEYPNGRTTLFTSTESDPFEGNYEAFYGTKGTLILEQEKNAYFFDHSSDKPVATQIEVAAKGGPVLETTESRPPDRSGRQATAAATAGMDGGEPYKAEISRWCAAIRTGTPIECGPDRAMHSAKACIRATEALEQQKRLVV